MNFWQRVAEIGGKKVEEMDVESQIEDAKVWPRDAFDEHEPFVAQYQGESEVLGGGDGAFKVLILKDEEGEVWKVSKNAAIKRAFAQQGEPVKGDGLYLAYRGQAEFTTAEGEQRTYNKMHVVVVKAVDEIPDVKLPF